MRQVSAVIVFLILIFSGCGWQEVTEKTECVKIVKTKIYQPTFLGIPFLPKKEYHELADGREIYKYDHGWWHNNQDDTLCAIVYTQKPKQPKLDLNIPHGPQ